MLNPGTWGRVMKGGCVHCKEPIRAPTFAEGAAAGIGKIAFPVVEDGYRFDAAAACADVEASAPVSLPPPVAERRHTVPPPDESGTPFTRHRSTRA